MRDVAEILVPWAVVTLALFAFLDWDESRLTPDQRGRAWPPATRTLAVVYFGVLAVPVHFWRTRRTEAGVSEGIDRGLVAFGLYSAAAEGMEALPEGMLLLVTAIAGVSFVAGLAWLSSRARPWKHRLE
jgi:hypothetical protein